MNFNKMLVIICSHGRHLSASIARKLNAPYSNLFVGKFPDDELRIRFDVELKKKIVVFVQSFYKNINDCIVEIIIAAKTAKELGAKKLILVAPYFPYFRQDKRFHKGEAISQEIIADLFSRYFDAVVLMDPHLHRTKNLNKIFKVKAVKLTANSLIAHYIKKHIKNPVIIGPDEESYKWAQNVAEMIKVEFRILEKKRYSSYHVEVKLNKKINLRSKNVVIVDDIVSTGNTILKATRLLRKLGAKNIYCICVHGIFVNNSLKKLQRNRIKIISTNTIPSKVARIDTSSIIADNLRKI